MKRAIGFVAWVLRISPELSLFCQAKLLILFVWLDGGRALDLRIGVRVPASQPEFPAFLSPWKGEPLQVLDAAAVPRI